jgi:hypothetical protein
LQGTNIIRTAMIITTETDAIKKSDHRRPSARSDDPLRHGRVHGGI